MPGKLRLVVTPPALRERCGRGIAVALEANTGARFGDASTTLPAGTEVDVECPGLMVPNGGGHGWATCNLCGDTREVDDGS